MSQGSGGGEHSGRGRINPNSVRGIAARRAPPRGVSAHAGKPRPSFRPQARLGGLPSEEVTPPVSACARAGFWSLIPDLIHSTNRERRLCVRLSALGVQLRPNQAWSSLSIGKMYNKQDLAGKYLFGVVEEISLRGEV